MNLKKLLAPYRGLHPGVYVLALANVITNLGSFVWPLMSLLLTDRLGLSKGQAGFFVTLMAVAQAPGVLLGGKLADHLGRKRIFLISRALGACALAPCAFLGNSPLIPWLFVANSVLSSASWPCVNAMVADLARKDDRHAAYSMQYLGLNIGFAIGPMIAGFLYRSYLPWLYLGDAITTWLSCVPVALIVPETLPGAEQRENAEGGETAVRGGTLAALLERPRFLVFAALMTVLAFVYVQYSFCLPLQAKESFPVTGPKVYGLLMSVNALVVIFGTAPLTYLTKRFPTTFSMGLGALLYAFGFGLNGFIGRSLAIFIVATLIWSVGEVVLAVNGQAYVADNSPVTHRARFSAAYNMIVESGRAVGPLIMGNYTEKKGIGAVWPVCFFLALPVSLLFFGQTARDRQRVESAKVV